MSLRSDRLTFLFCLGLLGLPVVVRAQVVPATTITATPASLTFVYTIGPTAKLPAAQSVALKSNDLNLVLTLTVSGDLPSNGDWLEPSYRRGTSIKLPGSVTVTVTPTSLSAGTYGATILLSGVDSHGTPVSKTVPVTLVVSAPSSQLDFSPPGGLAFTYVTGAAAPANQSFVMYTEGAPLTATVSVSGAPWLKVAPTGSVQVGGLFQPIVVSIDPAELAKLVPKVYTANISVAAPQATNKTATYPITLTVNAAKPLVTDTWPDGVVVNTTGAGATTIVIDGTGFFDTSTVAVTGFTSSSVITLTDGTLPTALTATETVSIPIYAAGVSFMRLTMGSPLPTGYLGTPYSRNLAAYVAGGTGPYTWAATGLGASGLALSSAGVLSGLAPVPGNYRVILTVTDANGLQAYMPVDLTIYGAAAPPAGQVWITIGAVIPSGTVGSAYSFAGNVAAAGGSAVYQWSVDASTPLPLGLTIATPGTPTDITGTPTSVGSTGILTQKRLSDGALQVTTPNSYIAKLGFLRMTVTTPAPGGGSSNEAQLEVYGPEPRILGVCNAASYASGTVSPGELVSIFGTGLGPAALSPYDPNANPLNSFLPASNPPAGVTRVSFTDGVTVWPAALLFTSAGQVGAMVPFEVAGAPFLTVSVSYAGLFSKAYPLTVASFVPGIFTADASGRGQGAILNVSAAGDYTINTGGTPALLKNNPDVILYVTGFGVTNPASGSLAPAAAGVDSAVPVTVLIDGKAAATVQSVVPQWSFPGILQLRVTVPSDAAPGKTVPIAASVGGVNAQNGVTMAIK